MSTETGSFMILKAVWLTIQVCGKVKVYTWLSGLRRIEGSWCPSLQVDSSARRHHDPSKDPEQLTHRQGVTALNTWKLSCKHCSQTHIQITFKFTTMGIKSDQNRVYPHLTHCCNDHTTLLIHLVTTNFRNVKYFRFCHFQSKYYVFCFQCC